MSHIESLQEHLNQARASHHGVGALTEIDPTLSVTDAYHVQLCFVDQEKEKGHRITGKKIGLTSKAMQESLGVNEPDYGHLFDYMHISPDKAEIPSSDVLQARVEGELAFVLKEDLTGPNVTVEDVLAATDYISSAIEIVDSRIADWKIKLQDTVADNGSSAFYILGREKMDPQTFDRIGVEMSLYKNGELINSGNGSAVLGDPAYCVAWLANKLAEFDITLNKGDVILSGALSAAIPAQVGDTFTCQFNNGLDDVTIAFTE